jgi:hypothetical protein
MGKPELVKDFTILPGSPRLQARDWDGFEL